MFQKIIEQKYLEQTTTSDERETAWQKYSSTCLNTEKQKLIRESKEEQYQEGFVRDLFCGVLGYTINPEPNYNVITEKKNNSDSRKADGAIIIDDKVRAVIELKGCDTTDLSKVENQAFGYKAHNPTAHYVIISNFEKLRFYIEDASSFLEFSLFTLNREQFDRLYLCLCLKNITADIPLSMKTETVSAEISITDKFYADYSTFKRNLFEDICQNNLEGESLPPSAHDVAHLPLSSGDTPQRPFDKLTLFKKTQKLLDRILFILFCEDRGLLPENSVNNVIIGRWQKMKEIDAYQPLYESFKNYFNRINTGYKSDDGKIEIFAYNGGLFKPDDILDNIKIGDDVLYIYSKKISEYDFVSEVSVNILGHIFEHSLTEIDEITNQITSGTTGETSKRKKDGVFYTPSYITKYIVQNTIGTLCNTKKNELGIDDETFTTKRHTKAKTAELDKNLSDYRAFLLSLKICDPACGSGAFLNAAYEFLVQEHHLVDELYAKLYNYSMEFQEVENDILEHNLFGVDINEESVEIAKLSLWLHTAKKGRKLTSLNNNIKCGNSLIDDPAIAGDKAFAWEKEFETVFANGGFDVVIGNPPWGAELSDKDKKYLSNYHDTSLNTAYLFIEKGLSLKKKGGYLFFIIPKGLSYVPGLSSMRRYIAENFGIDSIIDTSESFKNSGVELEAMMILLSDVQNSIIKSGYVLDNEFILSDVKSNIAITDENFSIWLDENKAKIVTKVKDKSTQLGNICTSKRGIGINRYVTEKEDDVIVLGGKTIAQYCLNFLTYASKEYIEDKFNWELTPKIILQEIVGRIGQPLFGNFRKIKLNAYLDEEGKFYTLDTVVNLFNFTKDFHIKYVLSILNCELTRWFFHIYQKNFSQLTIHSGNENSRTIPIPNIPLSEQQPFVELADKMLTLNANLQKQTNGFTRLVQNNLNIEKLSTTIQNFTELTFADFLKEIAKLKTTDDNKAKIALKDQPEWNETFDTYKATCTDLQQQITTTDNQINALVYKLYGLTEEEIKTVEGK